MRRAEQGLCKGREFPDRDDTRGPRTTDVHLVSTLKVEKGDESCEP